MFLIQATGFFFWKPDISVPYGLSHVKGFLKSLQMLKVLDTKDENK